MEREKEKKNNTVSLENTELLKENFKFQFPILLNIT